MKRGQAPRVEEAILFLKKGASKKPVPAAQVLDYVEANTPISRMTLFKAKKALGIRSFQKGHVWYWEWPAQD